MHRLRHKLSVVSSSKRCLMDLILKKLNIALRHFWVMCCLKLRLLSICTPRYLMESVLNIKSPATSMVSTLHLSSWHWLPKKINSVLAVFILSRVSSIHCLILSMQSSSMQIVSLSPSLSLALNSLLILWSSAKPLSCKLLGTTSWRGEQ